MNDVTDVPTGAVERRVIDGVPFDVVDESQAVAHVINELGCRRGGFVLTPNVDILRRLRRPGYRDITRSASLVLADGMPVIWASRLCRQPLPGRVAGSSLIFALSDAASAHGYGVFLLGGPPGAAERAGARLSGGGVRILGWHCPPFGFEDDAEARAAIVSALLAARPDVVFVGLGFPKQERLIAALRSELPAAWFVGCGASITFAAGDIARAPGYMQRTGLEWAHRLVAEPRRLARRYLLDDLPYAAGLLVRSALAGLRSTGER